MPFQQTILGNRDVNAFRGTRQNKAKSVQNENIGENLVQKKKKAENACLIQHCHNLNQKISRLQEQLTTSLQEQKKLETKITDLEQENKTLREKIEIKDRELDAWDTRR